LVTIALVNILIQFLQHMQKPIFVLILVINFSRKCTTNAY